MGTPVLTRRGAAAASACLAAIAGSLLVSAGPAAAVVADPIDQDLLLHYTFNDAIADRVIDDVSGNNRPGAVVGSNATVDTAAGVLTLPGGASGSTAGYVQIPTGTFDGQDNVTISTWLKNETGSGNYSAMFFGTTQATPHQYWILNPRNTAGRFKSVVTNTLNASAPWGTEYGISPTNAAQGVAGPLTGTEWAMYTTVISPTSITGYLDGEKIGTVPLSRTVTEFGTNLVSYIGKSSYADIFYKGGVSDVRVYSESLSDAEVSRLYLETADDADAAAAALASDAAALALPGTVISDIALPELGEKGSLVSWSSSNPDVISDTGAVTRPSGADATVTLTATLMLAGQTVQRDFAVEVLEDSDQATVDFLAESFELGQSVVWGDVTLPAQYQGLDVTWASSAPDVIGTDGSVVRPATETAVTLTATLALGSASVDVDVDVTALAEVDGYLGSYIRSGTTDDEQAVHFALSEDGATFRALNDNKGVLFPASPDTTTDVNREVGAPSLFHRPDGGYGLIALVTGASGNDAYVYETDDLAAYTAQRRVTFAPAAHDVRAVEVAYDNGLGAYRLTYVNATDGTPYEVQSADLVTFTAPVVVGEGPAAVGGTFPTGAIQPSVIGITAAEYAHLSTALLLERVHSTSVDPFDALEITSGETPALPETATVQYSSGNAVTMGVEWDLDAVDLTQPGVHTVEGTVQAPLHSTELDPVAWKRADPDVTVGDDGMYYLTGSYPMFYAADPDGYDRVVLRRASSIEGLADAESEEVTIWLEDDHPGYNEYVWAPELAKIGDDWYILFTTSRNTNVWDKQSAVLKFTGDEFAGDAPLDPANWETLGYVIPEESDDIAFTGNFALDMTHFEHNGVDYMIWADKWALSTLRMASVDTENPLQLTSHSIELTSPEYAWEIESESGTPVNEGASVLKHDGKIFIAFSSSAVNASYNISFLWADEDADLLDPASWHKAQYPYFGTGDAAGMYGMGHNSFTVDEYGQDVLVYHARGYNDTDVPAGTATNGGLFDPRRNAYAKLVHYNADGMPILDMTAAEELDPALAQVSIEVTVEAPALTLTDIASNPFKSEIQWLAATGVTTGWATSPGFAEFRPLTNVNRDQMAAFLYRLAGSPVFEAPSTPTFTDVPTNYVFFKEIEWLTTQGITEGWTVDGVKEFRPKSAVKRDVMAAFLYRFAGSPEFTAPSTSPFSDVKTGHVFYKEISWLASTGISEGWTVGSVKQFRPVTNVKRDVMAAFLYRYAAL